MSAIELETGSNAIEDEIIDIEWEEWDGKSPFLHHCIAGSIAGVAEHTILYPVDTVKTHMQAYCSACPDNKVCAVGGKGMNNLQPNLPKRGIHNTPPSAPPQGMWLTMRNLIQHGHSTTSVAAATTILKNARQTGTLTATCIQQISPLCASEKMVSCWWKAIAGGEGWR